MRQEEKRLREEAQIFQDSVEWWMSQANDLFCEVDEIHDKVLIGKADDEEKKRLSVIYRELEILIQRGRMETKNSFGLEKKIRDFLTREEGK